MKERKVGFDGRSLAYLDIETTGLDFRIHEITEISILKPYNDLPEYCPMVLNGWRAWTAKVYPTRIESADPIALDMNGFNASVWHREAISIDAALSFISLFLKDSTIVGHNVFMDMSFISEAFHRAGLEDVESKYRIDTSTLIWQTLCAAGMRRGSLHNACRALGISNEGEHTALADVLRTKAVLDRLSHPLSDQTRSRIHLLEAERASSKNEPPGVVS